MNISKNSWHFRLLSATNHNVAWHVERYGTSLCKYFWRILWEAIKCVAACITGVLLALGVIFLMLVAPIGFLFCGAVTLVAPALIGAALWAMFVLAACEVAVKHYREKRPKVEAPKKEPGLVISFLKAKKEKVCPLVKVV